MDSEIHQTVTFAASPSVVYSLLVDQEKFAAFTSAPAVIDGREGGAFSTFGGQIEGWTLELIENERVVQAWRVAGWETGVYSVARFDLQPSGGGCELTFRHVGYPSGTFEELSTGWHNMYWNPMTSFLHTHL